MMRNLFLVIFSLCFPIFDAAFAGWSNDGWIGIDYHHATRGLPLKLLDSQRQLAEGEQLISSVLPLNDKTNIVLGSVTFVGTKPDDVTSHLIRGIEGKALVFESG